MRTQRGLRRPPKHRLFVAYFEQEHDGTWSAHVPALPGCYSQGDTLDEAQRNIAEAIRAYLASLKKDELPLPDTSRALFGSVEVEA